MRGNYKTIKKLVCGKVREFVLMPTYEGEIKELWQEIATDKDGYYVYSYGKIIDGEFKHRYVGIGMWKRYKEAKRTNNAPLMGNLKSNHYHKIIVAKCNTREQAARIERDLISFMGRKDLGNGDLYNLSDGGEASAAGLVHSEETRKKISEAQKGENNPMYGRTGKKSSRWKDKSKITDQILFEYLQACKSWAKEIPTEWGVSCSKTLQSMFKKRYNTTSVKKVQKILSKRLGKHVLNHVNFLQYLKLYKYSFLQMAPFFFGISGEQFQRWCLRTYKSAESSTINGWERQAKKMESGRKGSAKYQSSKKQ